MRIENQFFWMETIFKNMQFSTIPWIILKIVRTIEGALKQIGYLKPQESEGVKFNSLKFCSYKIVK